MSVFSGKCDVLDHISGTGGWFDRDGNPVAFGQEGVSVYYSDEIKDFEAFKEQTNGILYQHKHIKEVSPWNQEFVKEHCPFFDYHEHVEKIPDKRNKLGYREEKYFTYTYFGKEYTQKELKKKGGVYITVEIHFETILDLIKYYPYLVSMSNGSTVYISDESFVEEEYDDMLQYGHDGMRNYYNKKLQQHYFEVCRDYLCYKLKERTKVISIDKSKLSGPIEDVGEDESSSYYLTVADKIDYNHPIEYVWDDGKNHSHWSSPKRAGDHDIRLSKQDVESYLKKDIEKGSVKIKYVKYPEEGFPTQLG